MSPSVWPPLLHNLSPPCRQKGGGGLEGYDALQVATEIDLQGKVLEEDDVQKLVKQKQKKAAKKVDDAPVGKRTLREDICKG